MRPVGRRWRRRGGRQEGRREGREMGMGMAEGEWAAKRGLPAPTLAGERAGSLGGRQATSRRSVEAVSISNSFPPSSVSCRNSPALPALGCFQTLGSRFLIWALAAAAAAPRVVSLSCTSEHSGSLGKCSSCTVGQYSRSSSLAPSPLLSRARCQFTRGIRRLLRRRRSGPSVRPSAFWTLGALNAPLLRQRTRRSSARPTPADQRLSSSSR